MPMRITRRQAIAMATVGTMAYVLNRPVEAQPTDAMPTLLMFHVEAGW